MQAAGRVAYRSTSKMRLVSLFTTWISSSVCAKFTRPFLSTWNWGETAGPRSRLLNHLQECSKVCHHPHSRGENPVSIAARDTLAAPSLTSWLRVG